MTRTGLAPFVVIAAIVLATCSVSKEIPVPLPDADTRVAAPAPVTIAPVTVEQDTDAAPQRVAGTEASRLHPIDRPVRWRRLNGGQIEANAPRGAVSYADGGLVRRVYRSVEECGYAHWVGKLRLDRGCGHPESTIRVEFFDGTVRELVVPTVLCGGY